MACVWGVVHAGPKLDEGFRPAFTTTQGAVLFALAVQPDDRVLVAGDFVLLDGQPRRGLARRLPNGALDPSFEVGAGVDGSIYAIAVQPADGRILVGGQFRTCRGSPRSSLARLNPDGTLDDSFQPALEGSEGVSVSAIMLQPDGRIVAGGSFERADGGTHRGVVRLMPSGRVDPSFDLGGGLARVRADDLALQADDRILVAGLFSANGVPVRSGLARFERDGRSDLSFKCTVTQQGGSGRVLAVSWHRIHGIIIGGVFDQVGGLPRAGLAKLLNDGSVDPDFDPQGGIAGDSGTPYDVAMLPDGAVMVTGSFWQAAGLDRAGVARLDPTGAADASFDPGDGLAATGDAFGNMLAVQADGQVLVAGQFEEVGGVRRHCLVRLRPDGTVDPGFSSPESHFEFGGRVRALAALPDGGALVGGEFERVNGEWRHALARLDARGELVPAFNAGLERDAVIHAIVVQPDGKFVIGGWFEVTGDAQRSNLARLLPDGAPDPGFAPHGADASVRALALLPDQRVIVAGEFRQFGDLRRLGMVRLGPDGEPEAGFEPRFEIGLDRAVVLAVALQADGRLLAGGYFDAVNGQSRPAIARLHGDGTLDTGFNTLLTDIEAPPLVTSLALRSDGRLLVGGRFHAVERRSRHGLARLYADGRLDASFEPGDSFRGTVDAHVEVLALIPDGQLAVGADSERHPARTSPYFALLSNLGALRATDAPFEAVDGPVHAIVSLPDGALLVGGAFVEALGQPRFGLARVTPRWAAPEHRLVITESEGDVRVHWDGGGRLLETSDFAEHWREVPHTGSPYSPMPDTGVRFYRWAE